MRFISFLIENDDWEDPKPTKWSNVGKAQRKLVALEHESEVVDQQLLALKKAGKILMYHFKFDIPDHVKDKNKYKAITCSFPVSDGMSALAPKGDWEWMAVFVPKEDIQLQQQVENLMNKKLAAHKQMFKELQ